MLNIKDDALCMVNGSYYNFVKYLINLKSTVMKMVSLYKLGLLPGFCLVLFSLWKNNNRAI